MTTIKQLEKEVKKLDTNSLEEIVSAFRTLEKWEFFNTDLKDSTRIVFVSILTKHELLQRASAVANDEGVRRA